MRKTKHHRRIGGEAVEEGLHFHAGETEVAQVVFEFGVGGVAEIGVDPEEGDDADFSFGDDYGEKAEIVVVEVAERPQDAPFTAFLEDERAEGEAVGVGVEDGPED